MLYNTSASSHQLNCYYKSFISHPTPVSNSTERDCFIEAILFRFYSSFYIFLDCPAGSLVLWGWPCIPTMPSRAIVLVTYPGKEDLLLHGSHPLFSSHWALDHIGRGPWEKVPLALSVWIRHCHSCGQIYTKNTQCLYLMTVFAPCSSTCRLNGSKNLVVTFNFNVKFNVYSINNRVMHTKKISGCWCDLQQCDISHCGFWAIPGL